MTRRISPTMDSEFPTTSSHEPPIHGIFNRRVHVSVLHGAQRSGQDCVEARIFVVGTTVTIGGHLMQQGFLVSVVSVHVTEPKLRVTAARRGEERHDELSNITRKAARMEQGDLMNCHKQRRVLVIGTLLIFFVNPRLERLLFHKITFVVKSASFLALLGSNLCCTNCHH